MDYTDLKLTDRQIRLIRIEPSTNGDPVRCRMEVRQQPLPVQAMIADSGCLPSNYISFDRYIKNPPEECFGASIRRDVAKIEQDLAREFGPGSCTVGRITLKLRDALDRAGIPSPDDIVIPVNDIPKMLTKEDVLSMAGDLRAGFSNMRIAHHESGAKHYGRLPFKKLNPFFRTSRSDAEQDAAVPDPNNYVALSYAWGPETPTATIIINNQPVEVRENLAAALKQLRTMAHFQRGGRIWIDALCINQADEREKAAQVRMMGLVYNLAGNIVVWLGEEADNSGRVIDWLEKLSIFHRVEFVEAFDGSDALTATTWRNMAQLRLRTVGRQILDDMYDKPGSNTGSGPGLPPGVAADIHRFFDRAYWRRLWIIQELAMGRAGMPIVCGSRVTQWRYVRDGLLLHTPVFGRLGEAARAEMNRHQDGSGTSASESETPLQHVAQIAQLEIAGHRRRLPHINPEHLPVHAPAVTGHGPLHGSPLRQALLLASRALCLKPHDRVYGMLSIPGLPRLGIDVDYSKGACEVFLQFTAACVESESLDFLSLVDGVDTLGTPNASTDQDQAQAGDRGSLPSWVPNYAARPERKIGVIDGDWHAGGQTGGRFPIFGGVMGSCFPPKVEGRKLVCSASVVDEIDGVGAVSQADIETGAFRSFGQEVTSVRQPLGQGSSWPPAKSVLHQVLVGGCDLAGSKVNVSEDFACLYTGLPATQPQKHSCDYRNWHFVNSSADLMVQGKPLSSYFTPAPADEAEHAPRGSRSPATVGAHEAMETRTRMRRLVVTKSGALGLAPAACQPGDAVIAIVGYGRPVIAARAKTEDGKPAWRIRGEAYVHGMMESERMPVNSVAPELMLESSDLWLDTMVFI